MPLIIVAAADTATGDTEIRKSRGVRQRQLSQSNEFRKVRERYIELGQALRCLPPGAERIGVVDEIRRLEVE